MRPYPPKLSNMIISSSTPNEWSKSSTVLDIIGGPLVRTALQQRTRLARWGCRRSSSSQKSADFWEPCLIGYLCGSSPMKKTILDLLHSNESKRNTIYSITQRYIRLNKNKGLVEPLVLIYILRINHQSYRT